MNILKKEPTTRMKLHGAPQFTVILVKDEKDGGYTAFFAQYPNIIAEGDTEDEATTFLFDMIEVVFEDKKNSELKAISKLRERGIVTTRTYTFTEKYQETK